MAAALILRKSTIVSWSRSLLLVSPCYCYLSTSTTAAARTIKQPNCSSDALVSPPSPPPEFFVDNYHFSPQTASKVASALARNKKTPQNPHLLLSFLKEEKGFSNIQLEKTIRFSPKLICFDIEKMVKPKFKILEDLGFSVSEVTDIIANNPSVLWSGEKKIIRSLSVLKCLVGSNAHLLLKLLNKGGNHWLFGDLEKTLLPNIEFLKSSGVSMEQIQSCLYTCSALFTMKPENMVKFVQKVDGLGVDRTSKMFIYAVHAVSHMTEATWELKLRIFRELGFSEDDILSVCRSCPVVLTVSEQKIKKIKEVLLETGKYDTSCIIGCPASLTRSVENRYKPRLHVLNVLEKRGLIGNWPSLGALSKLTDDMFFQKFISPNIDRVGEDFIGKIKMGTI